MGSDHAPLARRIAELELETRRLRDKLSKAETIIDVQKKLSRLLEMEAEKKP